MASAAPKSRTSKDPAAYTGEDSSAVKRAEAFQDWRDKIQLCWFQDAWYYDQDERYKFAQILQCLGGNAFRTLAPHVMPIIKEEDPTKWKWESAEALLAHLSAKYNRMDLTLEARRDLESLKMTKGMRWLDFEDKFVTVIDKCELDDAMKTHYLKMKVTNDIRDAIAHQQDTPAHNDFEGWLTLHRKLATNLEERDWRNKTNIFYKNGTSGAASGNAAPERTVSQGGTAMDLDAMNAFDVQLSRMIDKAVIDYRMQNGLCKRCAKPGHFAHECRNNINTSIPKEQRERDRRNRRGRGGYNNNRGRPAMGQSGYGNHGNNGNNGARVNAVAAGEPAAAAAPAAPAPAQPAEYGEGNVPPLH
ncbi:hypothetical protein QBC32DRAFT_147357 [Pseudoneurospora amorphoporcata]|uniref:CCHC-type domain-containing protein n=1 Tax=Pseudoneurospora amorphoporcata TaxID=241081 RepID=A0AAN6SAZ8_9PEZI|nr:hypothetical protein QBC32DRAFT_147357 [Pseudoneurospora amorphoporcata]